MCGCLKYFKPNKFITIIYHIIALIKHTTCVKSEVVGNQASFQTFKKFIIFYTDL